MTLPKSLVVALPVLMLCVLSSCSVQKRTTALGWHVEKAPSLFHRAGPSTSLTLDVKAELPALQRMNRLPPRALDWTTSRLPADTSAVDAKVKKKVRRALRREIRIREDLLMFPLGSAIGLRKREAEKWHDRAEQICNEQGQFLNEVAPDEFARLESLRYPGRETLQELKTRKTLTVVVSVLLSLGAIAYVLFLIALGSAFAGG